MAYAGTTSTAPNLPYVIFGPLGHRRAVHWGYRSTHTSTDLTDGFITDAQKLGMTLGDSVWVYGSTTYALTSHTVDSLTSTGASLSTGLNLSS